MIAKASTPVVQSGYASSFTWATLPNWITAGRLVFCAVFVAVTSIPWAHAWTTALCIFILASFTDWIDGVLARAWNIVSPLGQLMDPLADKILVTAALISLIPEHIVQSWLAMGIISREFLITGLRTLAALHNRVLSADKMGKWKTVTQITAIIVALVQLSIPECFGPNTAFAGFLSMAEPYLFAAALLITVGSGGHYLIKNRAVFEHL